MDKVFGRSISTLLSDDGQRMLLLLVIGAAVFLLLLGVLFLTAAATDPVRRRLVGLMEHRGGGAGDWANKLLRALQPAARYIQPGDTKERVNIEQKLGFAGFRAPNAVSLFYALKTGLSLTLMLIVILSAGFFAKASTLQFATAALVAAFVGMVVPNMVLDHLAERRKKKLRDAFPDALDLLVVCVEAGLGLTAAIQRVADELQYSHPELSSELATVTAEMRAGVDRETALKALTGRTGLEDVRGLVSLLVQTLRFGTSIGETLRVYSEEFRDKRMQAAEEMAAKIGTKLIFPLVGCLFPAFFVVAIGPAVIGLASVFRTLSQTH